MAETTGTSDTTGRDSAPGMSSPGTTDTTVVVTAGDTTPATTHAPLDPLQAEIDRLTQENKRYKEQLNGWEQQSRRNLGEVETLKERLARLEAERITPITSATLAPSAAPDAPRFDLKPRLQRWLNGDDAALDEIETALAQTITARASATGQALAAADVERLVQQQLTQTASRSQYIARINNDHTELADVNNPLFQDVYRNYEAYEADLGLKSTIPDDPQYVIPLNSPFEPHVTKPVDLRRIEHILWRLKAQTGATTAREEGVRLGRAEEQDAQGVGTVEGAGTGGTPTTSARPRTRAVEAWQLFDEPMQRQIETMLARKAIPAHVTQTRQGVAKWVFDGLDTAEQQRLIARYNGAARSAA